MRTHLIPQLAIPVLVLLLAGSRVDAQLKAELTEAKTKAYADSARLVDIFKDLHQHPELGFGESRTAAFLAKELRSLDYQVITGIGKTGLAAIFHNGEGPTVMYRTEMDALPVKEATGLSYASSQMVSKEDGSQVPVMHACGHDAHMSWMLGIAKIMKEMKSEWRGTLVFVAQPAEEIMTGADSMVKDNLYGRGVPLPDFAMAMHGMPFPVGTVQNCAGAIMAGSDAFDVTFHGIGGHGSSPHLTKDPVIMGATAILEYQTIVNRSISAQIPHVITVGSMLAGTTNNVIPSSATLKVNLRWFSLADRVAMIEGINRVDSSIAFANNLTPDLYPTVVMKGMVYPVKNDTALVSKINGTLSQWVPPDQIISRGLPMMVSEDFPYLVIHNKNNTPYDFLWIGIADPELCRQAKAEGKQFPFFNHNPNFAVDLSAIPYGTAVGATALLGIFSQSGSSR